MRTRSISTATALAVLFSSAVLIAASTGSAAAEDTVTGLPISSYADTAVDGGHDQVFVSDGVGGQIVVTDYSGTVLSTISGLPGVHDLALSDDSKTLYAAVSGADELVAFDTGTLDRTATYPTGDGTAPSTLAVSGGKLWFGYGQGAAADLGSVDPGTSGVTLSQSAGRHWLSQPALYADRLDPGVLVASDPAANNGPLVVYDASGDTPTVDAATYTGSTVTDVDFIQGAPSVMVASPAGLASYQLSDLSRGAAWPMSSTARGVAIGHNGYYATESSTAAGDMLSVYTWAVGPLPATRLMADPAATLPDHAVSWAPDHNQLFAVTKSATGSAYQLRAFTDANVFTTSATLTGPATAQRAKPLTLTGRITLPEEQHGGIPLTVTRTDMDHPKGGTTLPPVQFDGRTGAFSFTDTPYVGGKVTYRVTYPGNPASDTSPSTASTTVEVSRAAPSLTLSQNNTHWAYGSNVTFTAHLGATTNRTLEIYSDPWGADQPKTLLKKGIADAKGNVSVTVRLTRNDSVTAAFDGDELHAPVSVQATAYARVQIFNSAAKWYKTGKIGSTPYYFFNKKTSPVITTAMPYFPGRKQQLQLQIWDGRTWYDADGGQYFALTADGKSVVNLQAPGQPMRARMRASYVHGGSGDTVNDTTYGNWMYFSFTN